MLDMVTNLVTSSHQDADHTGYPKAVCGANLKVTKFIKHAVVANSYQRYLNIAKHHAHINQRQMQDLGKEESLTY